MRICVRSQDTWLIGLARKLLCDHASADAAIVTTPDAGALAFDDCEPFITPTSAFFVSNGGDGLRQGWEQPDLVAADYQLAIDGEVGAPRSLSLSDLEALRPQVTVLDTLQCLFGQRGTGLFRGVPLSALLEQAGLKRETALRVRFHGADGFGNNLRIEDEQVKLGHPWPFVGVATPWEHDFVASPGEHDVRIRIVDDTGATNDARAILVFDDEQDAG